MSTEEKSERRYQLIRQQHNEWNDALALETTGRNALLVRQDQERLQLDDGEINFHERARQSAQHATEMDGLKHQDRQIRIALHKRQTQETLLLNQQLL